MIVMNCHCHFRLYFDFFFFSSLSFLDKYFAVICINTEPSTYMMMMIVSKTKYTENICIYYGHMLVCVNS